MESGRRTLLCALVVVFIGVVPSNNGLKLPSYLMGCSRNDPLLNECALQNAINLFKSNILETGDRKYHVPIVDPLTITQLKIEHAGLFLNFDNLKMYGLKDIQMKAVRFDLKKLIGEYDFVIPKLKLSAKHTVKGQILVLPLAGAGNVNMTMTNVTATMSHEFMLGNNKNGKEHMRVTNGVLKSELDGFTVTMDGLFNGDKRLGDHMNEFLNENWQEVIKELKPSFNAALAKVADQVFNNLATAVPYSELFPEAV